MARPKKNKPLRELAFNTRVTADERKIMTAVYDALEADSELSIKSETDAMVHLYQKEFKRRKLTLPKPE